MTARLTSPARLVARLAMAGAFALGLAGGVASAASAAAAPVDDGRATVLVPERPGLLIPTTTTTLVVIPKLPGRPDEPDPHRPCDERTGLRSPAECQPPDPCSAATRGGTVADRCRPDPCRVRPGSELPERCPAEPLHPAGRGASRCHRPSPGGSPGLPQAAGL